MVPAPHFPDLPRSRKFLAIREKKKNRLAYSPWGGFFREGARPGGGNRPGSRVAPIFAKKRPASTSIHSGQQAKFLFPQFKGKNFSEISPKAVEIRGGGMTPGHQRGRGGASTHGR